MFYVVLVCAFLVAGCGGASVPWARLRTYPKCTSRIINGSPAEKGEFPSQLSLQFNEAHICGASIVNERWALTAAHCVAFLAPRDIKLISGTHDLSREGTFHPTSNIVRHSDYAIIRPEYDIALLKVSIPFDLDGTIRRPIKLPEIDQETEAESVATVIGWGVVSMCEMHPDRLQKVDIKIMDQEICEEFEDTLGTIYPSQICGYSTEEKGSCYGDSGSPLFVDGVAVGIVSYAGSHACAEPGEPTVFTRIASYVEWIEDVIACGK